MIGLLPAVMLSIAAAASYALAAVVQERLAARLLRESLTGALRRGGVRLLRRRRWWIAVGLSATAAVLHVLALRYGPLTVVQPLGALTLVLALPLSAAVVGRRVTTTEWRGAGLTLVGLTGLLLLAASDAPTTTLDSDEIDLDRRDRCGVDHPRDVGVGDVERDRPLSRVCDRCRHFVRCVLCTHTDRHRRCER